MRKNYFNLSLTISMLIVILVSMACSQNVKKPATLKDAYKDYFLVGTALTGNQILGFDTLPMAIVNEQFNSIVTENALKWDSVHPEQFKYTFAQADSFVAYGQRNNMYLVGHTLLWHAQTPKWIFLDAKGKDVSRDTLLQRLHDHIATVAGRYQGKIGSWDVVNEVLNEDGTMRKTKWFELIGEDYVQKAFEFAREADSSADLVYNDYNIELPAKRAGAIKLIKSLQEKGIKIDGVGIQAHWHMDAPSLADIDSAIAQFSALGIKVMLTELDINVLPRPENLQGANIYDSFKLTPESNPYPQALPDSMQVKLAQRYADIFRILCKHKGKVSRVTFWGISDGQSWLNGWPIPGRTNYPLLFDRNLKAKPVVDTLIKVAAQK